MNFTFSQFEWAQASEFLWTFLAIYFYVFLLLPKGTDDS